MKIETIKKANELLEVIEQLKKDAKELEQINSEKSGAKLEITKLTRARQIGLWAQQLSHNQQLENNATPSSRLDRFKSELFAHLSAHAQRLIKTKIDRYQQELERLQDPMDHSQDAVRLATAGHNDLKFTGIRIAPVALGSKTWRIEAIKNGEACGEQIDTDDKQLIDNIRSILLRHGVPVMQQHHSGGIFWSDPDDFNKDLPPGPTKL